MLLALVIFLECFANIFMHYCFILSIVVKTFNDWTVAIQGQNSITVAYIDFAKAFDTVSR